MSVQPLDYLVHFSNILLLVAYWVRDMLWLRWFAVDAADEILSCSADSGDESEKYGTRRLASHKDIDRN